MTREDFAQRVTARMLVGREEYGDVSFLRPREQLIGELAEEAMDAVGWSYILWVQSHGLDMADPLRQLPAFLAAVWDNAQEPSSHDLAICVATSGVCLLQMLERASG